MMRLGIDVGGTKLEILALDEQGQELLRHRVTSPSRHYGQMLSAIVELVHYAESRLGRRGTVGLGIPGALSPDHGRVKNANSQCLIGQDLQADLAARLERPVRIANDADCFAWSEYCDGAGKGAQSLFGVIVGTGVGGGLVLNGALLGGPNGIAGEWGHNPLPWPRSMYEQRSPCYCGRTGCIETWLSGPGFSRSFSDLAPDALATDLQQLDAPRICRLAQQGHEQAVQVLDDYFDRMARSLASVINIVDPAVIVLGGGMSNISALYSEIPRRWGAYIFSDRVNTRLLPAHHGDSSGVRGAAWLWPATEELQ